MGERAGGDTRDTTTQSVKQSRLGGGVLWGWRKAIDAENTSKVCTLGGAIPFVYRVFVVGAVTKARGMLIDAEIGKGISFS